MTLWPRPGGAGLTTKGTSTIRPLLGGLFVEEQIDGALNEVPFTVPEWKAVEIKNTRRAK